MKIYTLILFISLFIFLTSCKKAGLGGNASIAVFVYENQKLAPNVTVYLKFNSTKEPEKLADFDLVKNCDTSGHYLGHTHFSNLNAGNYYLIAILKDSTNKEIKKGKSVSINSETKNTETDVRIDL